jgi:hypothetical protein
MRDETLFVSQASICVHGTSLMSTSTLKKVHIENFGALALDE